MEREDFHAVCRVGYVTAVVDVPTPLARARSPRGRQTVAAAAVQPETSRRRRRGRWNTSTSRHWRGDRHPPAPSNARFPPTPRGSTGRSSPDNAPSRPTTQPPYLPCFVSTPSRCPPGRDARRPRSRERERKQARAGASPQRNSPEALDTSTERVARRRTRPARR